MASTKPSIRVVKSFLYRGVLKQWSNRYYFSGGTPSDSAHWTTLSDAIVTAEKAVHIPQGSGGSKIVETFGFAAGSEIPVFSKTYSTDGTMSVSGSLNPGDAATLVRYSTAARSSKNHPIYLFSYYHGGQNTGGYAGNDQVRAGDITAHNTYATLWDTTGFSDGANTYKRTSPQGHDATGHVVEPLVTHRDLRR
jgi:hypothetical protein